MCFHPVGLIGAARAELTIRENFANTALVLKGSASGMNTYELQGPPTVGVSRKVTATNRLLRTAPGVAASGPLGQPWVFSTGVSTMFRYVHWNHYVDLRYTFNDPMDAASVKLKYINTRACGGFLHVFFAQYDEAGRVVWEGYKLIEGWGSFPGPYSDLRPRGNLADRKWRSYALSLADVKPSPREKSTPSSSAKPTSPAKRKRLHRRCRNRGAPGRRRILPISGGRPAPGRQHSCPQQPDLAAEQQVGPGGTERLRARRAFHGARQKRATAYPRPTS